MDELIQQLTSKLGIDASVANNATSKAFAMIKDNVGDDLFQSISASIPQADQAAAEGAAESGEGNEGGGMFGKLAGIASGALGGSAGSAIELGSALSSAGLDQDQIGKFVSTVVEFIKANVGDETMNQILSKFPILKNLMG